MNNEAGQLIEKLLNYYSLITMQDLAAKLNIKQSSLSSWKTRNSVNAIKKKCRELGIHQEIFGDVKADDNGSGDKKEKLVVNSILLEKAREEAEKFGLDVNSYIEHLIVQDLKK